MRTGFLVVGLFTVLMGLVWAAQGSGYFPYPASSFMIDNQRWIFIGLATVVAGAALIAWSRR
jgi:hypothetical protein